MCKHRKFYIQSTEPFVRNILKLRAISWNPPKKKQRKINCNKDVNTYVNNALNCTPSPYPYPSPLQPKYHDNIPWHSGDFFNVYMLTTLINYQNSAQNEPWTNEISRDSGLRWASEITYGVTTPRLICPLYICTMLLHTNEGLCVPNIIVKHYDTPANIS